MTNDEIRIAVAEELGWKWGPTHITAFGATEPLKGWFSPHGNWSKDGPPNYPEDLNACHEMEKTLKHEETTLYQEFLGHVVLDKSIFNIDLIMAASHQRCEAFLRLRGKWKEDAK